VLTNVFVVMLKEKGLYGGAEHCALEKMACLELIALGRVAELSLAIRCGAGVGSPWLCDQIYRN